MEKENTPEHELGRWKARADRLEKELEAARAGLEEVRRAADALMIRTALACGEETDSPAGKRLVLPCYDVADTLARYRLRVHRDGERGAYVLWAMERA